MVHTQAPPGEAAVPAGESVQEPAGGADAPAEEEPQPGEAEAVQVTMVRPLAYLTVLFTAP